MIPETSEYDADFGTLKQIEEFAKENNVPEDASIVYSGCGSHRIEFVWDEEQEELMDSFRQEFND